MQTTGQGEGSVQKMRVYEVAKDVGLANKDLVDKIRALGIEVKNHMSALEPEDVNRVKRALEKERMENTVVERIQPTVIRRRNKNGPPVEVKAAPTPGVKRRGADESKGKMEDIALPLRRTRPAPVVEPEPPAPPVHEAKPVAPPPAHPPAPAQPASIDDEEAEAPETVPAPRVRVEEAAPEPAPE